MGRPAQDVCGHFQHPPYEFTKSPGYRHRRDTRWLRDERTPETLENDLSLARQAILVLLPPLLYNLLYDCRSITSRRDAHRWLNAAVATLMVEVRQHVDGTSRVPCPLCKGVPETVGYGRGYSYPLGLEWHLTGGAAPPQCIVFRQVQRFAEDVASMAEEHGGPLPRWASCFEHLP